MDFLGLSLSPFTIVLWVLAIFSLSLQAFYAYKRKKTHTKTH